MPATPQPTEEPTFPTRGCLMGFDYGAKRIGVALSNPEQTFASPLKTHTRQEPSVDLRQLCDLMAEYRAVGLVVGLPVHMSGDEGAQAQLARNFGDILADESGLPVRFWDERYTSAIAEEHLLAAELTKKQRKARIDKLAAQIMLQSFLQTLDRDQPPAPLV